MYVWPVTLPIFTNREDLLLTVGLFDDDTGQAIDISGRTLAASGDFTGSSWTVTDGAIVTTSTSTLKIKDYPIQNEMQALSFVVGTGLGILAGDPITIADLTGLNTMTGYVTSYVASTGAIVCQIGAAFDFEIRGHHHCHDGGYGPEWAVGSAPETPLITALLGSGLSVVELGKIQIRIPASTMAKLRHRTYSASMAVYLGGDTRQIFAATLPIISGGLSTQPFALVSNPNPYGLP